MSDALRELFACRLLLVSGKGGTGKSTVAAALAHAAAQRGLRALVVELGPDPVLPPLLSASPPPASKRPQRDPVELAPGLFHLRLVPELALAEVARARTGGSSRCPPLASRAVAAGTGERQAPTPTCIF